MIIVVSEAPPLPAGPNGLLLRKNPIRATTTPYFVWGHGISHQGASGGAYGETSFIYI